MMCSIREVMVVLMIDMVEGTKCLTMRRRARVPARP